MLAFVVERLGDETALSSPVFDGAGVQAGAGGELFEADEASCLEPLAAGQQAVLATDVVDHDGVEGWSVPGQDAVPVELLGDAGFGVVVEKPVDFSDRPRAGCGGSRWRSGADGDLEGGGLAGFEANLDGDVLSLRFAG